MIIITVLTFALCNARDVQKRRNLRLFCLFVLVHWFYCCCCFRVVYFLVWLLRLFVLFWCGLFTVTLTNKKIIKHTPLSMLCACVSVWVWVCPCLMCMDVSMSGVYGCLSVCVWCMGVSMSVCVRCVWVCLWCAWVSKNARGKTISGR